MNDYKERFEAWQKRAAEKFEEIDAQLGLKEKIEEGARAIVDTAQKGADYVRAEAEKTDIGKQAVRAAEDLAQTASGAVRSAWNVSRPVRNAAADAGSTAGGVVADAAGKAGEFVADAATAVEAGATRIARMVGFGASMSSALDAALKAAQKGAEWVREEPARAAATGAAMAIGAGLGVILTGISSHWLLNSAIPAHTVKLLAENFDGYLKRREELIAAGRLSDADKARYEFERDIAKSVGAPLLGAFSFASGAVMFSNVFNPGSLTGFPIGTIVGGDPVLEGVWFFGNGIVCFKTSYDFFMIALEGQQDVEKMVGEIRAMLPASA
jgi:hypothetical protein